MAPHHRSLVPCRLLLVACSLLATRAILAADAAPSTPRGPTAPNPSVTKAESAAVAADSSIIQLSPFEVVSDDRGYYATNTTSGTRLNSKVNDLAASITVVNKDQMADFALLDLNDIFNYEAGTEGTGNFTDISFDSSGQPIDGTQLSPQTANRIRGVGPANITFGNFETSGRVPIDPINIDAVEISRGPNSSIFGIGSPAGAVNSTPAAANLSRNRSQISLRVDSNDGYRSTLDLNRVLKKNVLAVRGSAVRQHDGFNLKPSGTDTLRLNGMVKFRPFKSTAITASHSYYQMDGNRPNTGMPRDGITGWRAAGAPTWDPITASGKLNDVRFTANTAAYFQTVGLNFSQIYVDREGISYWTTSRTTSTNTPISLNQTIGFRGAQPDPSGFLLAQPLYLDNPVLTNRSIYNWKSLNLAASNRVKDETESSSVLVDHLVFETPRQSLALQFGWFREAAERFERNPAGQPPSNPNSVTLLQPDINERLLDGSPNPFFLRPFLAVASPSFYERPLDNDTLRAQLAYSLDLRRERGLFRWLGLHHVSGYAEYKDYHARNLEYKDAIVDQHAWLPPGASRANLNGSAGGLLVAPGMATGYFRYYLGDNVGDDVEYPAALITPGRYTMTWGNGVTGQFNREPVELGTALTTASKSRTILRSRGAILQSHLLRERVVTTFGWRYDERAAKRRTDFRYMPDGIHLDSRDFDHWKNAAWTIGRGNTTTAGVVVKPLKWLSVFANKSDSFQPQSIAYNLRLQALPDPQGAGKDYGVALNLFQGRLVVRANRYTTSQINARNGVSGNLALRIMRIDHPNGTTAAYPLLLKANEWVAAAAAARGETLTAATAADRVAAILQLPRPYLDYSTSSYPITANEDTLAKGTEIEINFNPTNYWTTKLNVTQQDSRFAHLSPDINSWAADRLPVWQSIIDPLIGRPWFTERYNNTTSASEFYQSQVVAPLAVAQAMEGKSKSQIRKYRANLSANFRLAGITEQRVLKRFNVGGALRWEDKATIGYYGMQTPPAIVTALDPNRPIYDSSHLYVDLLAGYRTSFFSDKVQTRFQLNVRNVTEGGRLQPISADPDGRPTALRIIDPRLFILSVTFDL